MQANDGRYDPTTTLDVICNALFEQMRVPAYVDSFRVAGCTGKDLARKRLSAERILSYADRRDIHLQSQRTR